MSTEVLHVLLIPDACYMERTNNFELLDEATMVRSKTEKVG
jgi:hypothetical protein